MNDLPVSSSSHPPGPAAGSVPAAGDAVAPSSPPPPVVELCQLSLKECFVYQVPPLKTASGHRAEEWGLEKPLLTGHLKVFQRDDRLRVVLYRYLDPSSMSSAAENLAPFAECPIHVQPGEVVTPFVDGVIDSSRYFVLRIQDPSRPQRTMMLGIGFRERDTALDFKQTLNDYVRFVDRMAAAEAASSSSCSSLHGSSLSEGGAEGDGESLPVAPLRDLSIKEGQKIHINVKSKSVHQHAHVGASEASLVAPKPASSLGGGGFALRPPPPPGSVVGGGGAASKPAVSGGSSSGSNISSSSGIIGSGAEGDAAAGAEEEWSDFA